MSVPIILRTPQRQAMPQLELVYRNSHRLSLNALFALSMHRCGAVDRARLDFGLQKIPPVRAYRYQTMVECVPLLSSLYLLARSRQVCLTCTFPSSTCAL